MRIQCLFIDKVSNTKRRDFIQLESLYDSLVMSNDEIVKIVRNHYRMKGVRFKKTITTGMIELESKSVTIFISMVP